MSYIGDLQKVVIGGIILTVIALFGISALLIFFYEILPRIVEAVFN